jgi:hypothetical protein
MPTQNAARRMRAKSRKPSNASSSQSLQSTLEGRKQQCSASAVLPRASTADAPLNAKRRSRKKNELQVQSDVLLIQKRLTDSYRALVLEHAAASGATRKTKTWIHALLQPVELDARVARLRAMEEEAAADTLPWI